MAENEIGRPDWFPEGHSYEEFLLATIAATRRAIAAGKIPEGGKKDGAE